MKCKKVESPLIKISSRIPSCPEFKPAQQQFAIVKLVPPPLPSKKRRKKPIKQLTQTQQVKANQTERKVQFFKPNLKPIREWNKTEQLHLKVHRRSSYWRQLKRQNKNRKSQRTNWEYKSPKTSISKIHNNTYSKFDQQHSLHRNLQSGSTPLKQDDYGLLKELHRIKFNSLLERGCQTEQVSSVGIMQRDLSLFKQFEEIINSESVLCQSIQAKDIIKQEEDQNFSQLYIQFCQLVKNQEHLVLPQSLHHSIELDLRQEENTHQQLMAVIRIQRFWRKRKLQIERKDRINFNKLLQMQGQNSRDEFLRELLMREQRSKIQFSFEQSFNDGQRKSKKKLAEVQQIKQVLQEPFQQISLINNQDSKRDQEIDFKRYEKRDLNISNILPNLNTSLNITQFCMVIDIKQQAIYQKFNAQASQISCQNLGKLIEWRNCKIQGLQKIKNLLQSLSKLEQDFIQDQEFALPAFEQPAPVVQSKAGRQKFKLKGDNLTQFQRDERTSTRQVQTLNLLKELKSLSDTPNFSIQRYLIFITASSPYQIILRKMYFEALRELAAGEQSWEQVENKALLECRSVILDEGRDFDSEGFLRGATCQSWRYYEQWLIFQAIIMQFIYQMMNIQSYQ